MKRQALWLPRRPAQAMAHVQVKWPESGAPPVLFEGRAENVKSPAPSGRMVSTEELVDDESHESDIDELVALADTCGSLYVAGPP